MVSKKIMNLVKDKDKETRQQIISKYFSELGKKSAEVNIRKGSQYWRDLAIKSAATRRALKAKIEAIAEYNGSSVKDVERWSKREIEAEYFAINEDANNC